MSELVPAVVLLLCESKVSVSEGSITNMEKICQGIDNPDVNRLIPALMAAVGDLANVEYIIYKLAVTTFVAQTYCNSLVIIVLLTSRRNHHFAPNLRLLLHAMLVQHHHLRAVQKL